MAPRDPARVLLVSMRNMARHVSRCGGYEFEDTIAASDHVDVVAPIAIRRWDQHRLTRYVSQLLGVDERLANVEATADAGYDLFFAMCLDPRDLRYMPRLTPLRARCRQSVCVVGELWLSQLREFGPYLDQLKDFDLLFTNIQSAAEAIQAWTGRPCHYLPLGVDAVRFCPFPGNAPRSIDVYSIGRRIEDEHRVLEACADRGELFYIYDTVSNFDVIDPREHRVLVANHVKRSRYFITYPAKFTEHAETGGRQEMGLRFFEGAAAGAVMIGRPPHSAAYDACFDWPDAVVPTSSDSRQIAALIAELDAQPERMQQVRRTNVVQSLRRHDWVYRWRDVLDRAGLPATSRMVEREARLASLARAVEGLGGDSADHPPAGSTLAVSSGSNPVIHEAHRFKTRTV